MNLKQSRSGTKILPKLKQIRSVEGMRRNNTTEQKKKKKT